MGKVHQNLEERRTGYLKILSVCCVLLTFIAVTVTLYQLRAILVPFTLSVFLFFILSPTVDFFERELKIPRSMSIALSIVGSLLLTTLVALILTMSFANLLENSDLYISKLQLTIANLNQDFVESGIKFDLNRVQSELQELSLLSLAQQFTSGFLGMMGSFTLVLIFTAFFLLGKAKPTDRSKFLDGVGERVSKYVSLKFVVSLATGFAVGIALKIIGVEFAMTFGVLAFILNFIPNIGSIVATLLPLPIVFLEYGLGWHFAFTLLVPGIIQMYVGNVLEPRLMGENLGLHPIVVLFFLFFWGIVWGLPGMFLSVPIMATIKFILNQMKSTRFIVHLLEGEVDLFLTQLPR